jgi:hypothetical protein
VFLSFFSLFSKRSGGTKLQIYKQVYRSPNIINIAITRQTRQNLPVAERLRLSTTGRFQAGLAGLDQIVTAGCGCTEICASRLDEVLGYHRLIILRVFRREWKQSVRRFLMKRRAKLKAINQ